VRFAWFIASVWFGIGCAGAGSAPRLDTVEDKVAVVGDELRIDLAGTDPDGDRLDYSFQAPAALTHIEDRTTLSIAPGGSAVFRWTPIATDVGTHAFDFIVSDGSNDSMMTISIDVVASATAPIFRSPHGTGTTLDLTKQSCLELDVVVEDHDTSAVTLGQEEPVIAGATLVMRDPMHATWRWCPTPAQRAESRHTLVLAADDGRTKTIKNYIIVLREPAAPTCTDDSHEQDDTGAQARETSYPTFASTANQVCKNDDDWFAVPLYAGEVMTVDLVFAQTKPSEDLDLHLYNGAIDLTPCSAQQPELCDTDNGQSGDSNERMTFTAPAACTSACSYFVVVRGFDGASSPYGITISID
jgi:hypothetical protein